MLITSTKIQSFFFHLRYLLWHFLRSCAYEIVVSKWKNSCDSGDKPSSKKHIFKNPLAKFSWQGILIQIMKWFVRTTINVLLPFLTFVWIVVSLSLSPARLTAMAKETNSVHTQLSHSLAKCCVVISDFGISFRCSAFRWMQVKLSLPTNYLLT